MKKFFSNFIIIAIQLFIVGLFFTTIFNKDVKVEKYVSTIHNDNLNKIANSVSLLFKDEDVSDLNNKLDDYVVSELPSIDKVDEELKNVIASSNENSDSSKTSQTSILYSIDASKYSSNVDMGFNVTEGNKEYNLSDYEFNVVVAVVAGEFDRNLNDALGVVSVILNRCDSAKWASWAGSTPYDQVIMNGQFEVYFAGLYLDYMPNGSKYNSDKYNIAKQAVVDGLNGIRNNDYLGFRAWYISGYSDNYIVYGGNRYGYN